MRRSGVAATTTTGAKTSANIPFDSAKARFFYQGVFALKRLQPAQKSKSTIKKPASTDSLKR
jgi:hypothetical protein